MKPVQVSQVNKYIKNVLQSDPLLSRISVIGEVSNLKYHGSGHVYFSMKDNTSRINCFLPENKAAYLRYPLEEGMEIVASGYIYLYEKGGSYSLNISDIRIEGEGNLAAAFEKLKKKLEGEGLFSPQYKKPLPQFPETVGIVTSATGAAVWDMIRTIKNKNNVVNIILCPCLVQGDGASGDIEDGIKAFNRMEEPPDVIIVGRGGGSMEDLWAFNEERVARSIFNSKIPVISAVGHETDFTIADFVADYRAATPTAAAEAAVPDINEIKNRMKDFLEDCAKSVAGRISYHENALKLNSPQSLAFSLRSRLTLSRSRIDSLMNSSVMHFKEKLHKEEIKIERLKNLAESMNPDKILDLGYGALSDENGRFIKSVSNIEEGNVIGIKMKDGSAKCKVMEVTKKGGQKNV